MTPFSKEFRLLILAQALFAILILTGLSWHFATKQKALSASTGGLVEESRETLITHADFAKRNLIDEEWSKVLVDCKNRPEFDQLLIKLDTLRYAELQKAASSFEACGDYFAVKKASVALRMSRELEILRQYILLYEETVDNDKYEQLVPIWEDIVSLENLRGKQLREQARIQGEIIEELLAGRRSSIDEKIRRAGELAELFDVENKQLGTLRLDEERVWADIASE